MAKRPPRHAHRGTGGGRKRRRRRGPARPPAHRLVVLLAVMALGFGGIFARLVVLQVADASAYQQLARDQRGQVVNLAASRGSILDRDRHGLAISLPAKAVFADPALVEDPGAVAEAVAEALGLDVEDVHSKITGEGRFVYLQRGVDLEVAADLQELNLPGIGFLDESRRYYPAGDVGAQVLGFVGVDGTGLEGMEGHYDQVLAGRSGRVALEEDPNGTPIPQAVGELVPPRPGHDLVLALDMELQFRTQQFLAQAVRENRAKRGTVIVMDPKTGEILAMAMYPSFDPNRFMTAPAARWRNWAVADVFEPGSVNKVIIASTALEEGFVTLDERFTIEDTIRVADREYHDDHPHPPVEMTLADIVAESSNVGVITVAERVGAGHLSAYLNHFGFGTRTGVGVPGEAPGLLSPVGSWSGTDLPSISIGQAVAVTALQMTCVYATIANGGEWVQPRLALGTVDSDDRFHPFDPPHRRRVISAETADIVTAMLGHAVSAGTGHQAQIEDYWVAGKTGTARKPVPGGYSETKHIASFVGFVPAGDPALVVAAILDEPETIYGGRAAAPLFEDVARFALVHLGIPPAAKPPTPPHAVPTD